MLKNSPKLFFVIEIGTIAQKISSQDGYRLYRN